MATSDSQATTLGDRWADASARFVAGLLSLSMLLLVLLSVVLVAARYAFDSNSIAAQEAQQWLHSLCFLFGAALTLRQGGHVRVDVLYARWSESRRALIDLLGTLLFLLPFAVFMLWISLDYVGVSLQMREASPESGGLPATYLLKAMIPAAAALLLLQALIDLRAAWRRWQR